MGGVQWYAIRFSLARSNVRKWNEANKNHANQKFVPCAGLGVEITARVKFANVEILAGSHELYAVCRTVCREVVYHPQTHI